MDQEVQRIIRSSVLNIIDSSVSESNILNKFRLHREKVHFVPMQYRVLGGILQSLNIKFGNFIEHMMQSIMEIDKNISLMPDSGKRVRLYMTPETDSLIDSYITSRQLPDSSDDCEPEFNSLLNQIWDIENSSPQDKKQGIIKDIDALFKTKFDQLVFVELKYNDDHDTGKFVDINRKFIKTWAGLINILDIQNRHELQLILYYLNPTKRYGPIYTPSSNIMRGTQLFDAYFETSFQDVDHYLHALGEDPEIMERFDSLYKRVRYGAA
jgi:hypothetical protein